jgi:hypothetical protein
MTEFTSITGLLCTGPARFSRRRFLQTSTAALAGLGLTLRAKADPAGQTAAAPRFHSSERLSGFVVSDAHFGWANPQQPGPPQIRAAMEAIMKRFPQLDVFFDTGDATHSYGTDLDRGHWMEIIQGGCGRLPFHFVTGNHDQAGPWYVIDPEHHVQTLGSHSCRPFFSFDLKNVHFVMLPQLMVVSLVTREALEWLKLDLELNKDRTTLIFSHNALRGTTWKSDARGDNTYRLVANTDEIEEIFNRYPNVKAWMHGHNHDFVVVRKRERLYVSNGRIGGFDPHKNSLIGDSLGGFWFEVGTEELTVRAYAGNKDRFLDEIAGFENLRQTLKFKSSLDASAPASISFGSGNSLDGQRWPIYNHYTLVAAGKQELFAQASAGPVINNDPAFAGFLEGSRGRDTPGYDILPVLTERRAKREGRRKGREKADRLADAVDRSWEFLNPGIKLLKLADPSVVRRVRAPGRRGTRSNWRCVPGRTYRVTVDLEAAGAGPTTKLLAILLDSNYTEVKRFDSGTALALPAGTHQVSFEFRVPELEGLRTIYSDARLDTTCYVTLEAAIENLVADVAVREFMFSPSGGTHGEAGIVLNGNRLTIGKDGIARSELKDVLPGRSVAEIQAPGSRAVTWLIRQTGLAFQVRNGMVEDKGEYLQVTGLRNRFSQQEEIVFAPLTAQAVPWVHRIRHVNRARIYRWDAQARLLRIVPEDVFGVISLDVVMPDKPSRVTGAEMWEHSAGLLRVWARGNGPVQIVSS